MLSQHYVNVATSAILRILSVSLLVALFNVVDCQSGASGRSATATAPVVTGLFFLGAVHEAGRGMSASPV